MARRSSGSAAFTLPRVPTGMKAGVWTLPWPVLRIPHRARLEGSRRVTSKNTVSPPRSMQEHGVAVAVEAVAAPDGLPVGRQNPRSPGEGGDEQEKGRARQMEIGDQSIHAAEAVARQNV